MNIILHQVMEVVLHGPAKILYQDGIRALPANKKWCKTQTVIRQTLFPKYNSMKVMYIIDIEQEYDLWFFDQTLEPKTQFEKLRRPTGNVFDGRYLRNSGSRTGLRDE